MRVFKGDGILLITAITTKCGEEKRVDIKMYTKENEEISIIHKKKRKKKTEKKKGKRKIRK